MWRSSARIFCTRDPCDPFETYIPTCISFSHKREKTNKVPSYPLSIFHRMNIELALQLLSTVAVVAVGPAVVVLLFLQKGNL